MGIFYVTSQALSTAIVCYDYEVLIDTDWASLFLLVKSEVVIFMTLCFNTAIAIIVLP